jgi:beta-lactamase class A
MRDITPEVAKLAADLGGRVSVSVRSISSAFDFDYAVDERYWSASTIKIPVLVEAVRKLADGTATLDTEFILDDENRTPGSGVLRYMHGGMKLTYRDVMVLMIITSDNLATNLLIDYSTPAGITTTMRGFGYTGTEVQRRIYDYDGIAKGLYNWIVASEIADLCKRIYTKQAIGGEFDELALQILSWQGDKERLRVLLPSGVNVANKPGEVDNIMHDGGLIWTGDFAYSICVCTSDWQSRRDAFMTIARISRLVYDAVEESRNG